MWSFLFILSHVFFGLLLFYNFYFKRRNLPPGPTPWPLIGNTWEIQRMAPGECYRKWQVEYGDVYTYWLGEHPVVCITDYQTMVNTMVKNGDAYAGRYNFVEFENWIRGGVYGVVFTDGELWQEHRQFAINVLKKFGIGKNLMQEKILDEITTLFDRVEKQQSQNPDTEVDIGYLFDIGVGSIINSLLFGYRFVGDKEKEFYELKKLCSEYIKEYGHAFITLIVANLKFKNLPFFKQKADYYHQLLKKLVGFFESRILEHKNLLGEEVEDYVGAYLAEKVKLDRSGKDHNFSIVQLESMCLDLWTAGQETTSITLSWTVAHVLNNPHVLDKIYEELDRVIGSDRLVTVSDRTQLPYLNAEGQRVGNIVPSNVLHRTTKDVIINGYPIPKDTCVNPQLSTLFINPDIFENPRKFYPERFINENGELVKCDELIPFSLGKRQCLGEALARMELFLFTANVFNRYKLSPGKQKPSLERTYGASVSCPQFTCKVSKRHP